ncbi:hypothetical protein T459_32516 [Capsicum annuum]|uniref:TIR domain-containing protein n=1 Tax=Capsicum annuum TaxID=4072 RepID=A0A2G2Y1T0_CAPAN|nr:hypothetical protein T459_32516 [Capsicum annuum]
MSVIVLSQNYASSEKCLDELVMILEQKRNFGHIVLPVFFDVDPSDVRKQKASFGEEYFRILNGEEERIHKVKNWSKALKEVADLGGMPAPCKIKLMACRHEAKFIENIVEKNLRPTGLHSVPYLIDINYQAEDIISWLQDSSTNVGLYVICGIGGIGKTTIAKYAYNSFARSFEGRSFLANINETAKQCNGLVRFCMILLGKRRRYPMLMKEL